MTNLNNEMLYKVKIQKSMIKTLNFNSDYFKH